MNTIPEYLRTDITHAHGKTSYDPNTLVMAVVTAESPSPIWPPLQGGEAAESALSGEPAAIFKTHQVQIPLTDEEIKRMVMLNLRPDEVRTLIEKFGIFHEIHDDFYDSETFEALQPRV